MTFGLIRVCVLCLGSAKTMLLRFDDVLDRIHPDDRARVVAEAEHAHQAGVAFEGEFRVIDS